MISVQIRSTLLSWSPAEEGEGESEPEEEFKINIPDDAAEKIQTVGQAVEFIEKSQA